MKKQDVVIIENKESYFLFVDGVPFDLCQSIKIEKEVKPFKDGECNLIRFEYAIREGDTIVSNHNVMEIRDFNLSYINVSHDFGINIKDIINKVRK